jgi:hypothetical protein
MSAGDHIALIDRLRGLPAETEWCEFKRTRCEPQALGEYLSALANSACLSNQPRGCLLFGIDDRTHAIAGTGFDPYVTKGKGNQDLLPWLAAGLRPNTGFETRVVEHPDGTRSQTASEWLPGGAWRARKSLSGRALRSLLNLGEIASLSKGISKGLNKGGRAHLHGVLRPGLLDEYLIRTAVRGRHHDASVCIHKHLRCMSLLDGCLIAKELEA